MIEMQFVVNVDTNTVFRTIYSESKTGSAFPNVKFGINADNKLECRFVDNLGLASDPAISASAVSAGWHLLGFCLDEIFLTVSVDKVRSSPAVVVAGDFDQLNASTMGANRAVATEDYWSANVGRGLAFSRPLTTLELDELYTNLKKTYSTLP